MLTLCTLYFIITAVQFWISDYMISVLGIFKGDVFLFFVIISTTAPTIGIAFGGYISQKIGGYTGKYALSFCFINIIFATMVSLPIPFIRQRSITIILFWLLLFFGASISPTLNGLMISSVP